MKQDTAYTKNICKFLPKFDNYNYFNIINLVYETKCPKNAQLKSFATYCMYLITEGEGRLRTENNSETLTVGDVVIMPPATYYAIENAQGVKYVYISYLGIRANILADEYSITSNGAVYHGYEHLIPIWLSAFKKHRENTNTCCEGIVLYTFSEIGNELYTENKQKNPDKAAEKIKNYIDEHFTNPHLNVEQISDALSYSEKYVSHVFKKEFNIRTVDYIRTLRIQHACTLMEQGLTSLKNISSLCGYKDSLYFSEVFKKVLDITPREYIKNLTREK